MKTVFVLILGWLLFDSELTLKNLLRMAIAVLGMVLYSWAVEADKAEPIEKHGWDHVKLLSNQYRMKGSSPVKDTINEFESSWLSLPERYFVMDNEWLRSMCNARQQWVPVYMRDTFFRDFSISDRNGGLNSFSEGFVNASTTIQMLMKQYEKALANWHEKELKAEYDTTNTPPVLKTPSPMEKQAANLYTRRIFMKFQEELVETLANPATKIDDSGTVTTYRVAKFGEEHKAHTHILAVSGQKMFLHCLLILNILRQEALKYVEEGAKSIHVYNVAMNALQKALKKVTSAKDQSPISTEDGAPSNGQPRVQATPNPVVQLAVESLTHSSQQTRQEPEKVTGTVDETQMDASKPVTEEDETVVVAKAEAEGQAPMEAETGAGEGKGQVQVEEPTKLEDDDGKLQAEPVGDNPDSVEQQVVEDTGRTIDVDDTGAQNEEKLKPEESVDVEFKDVEDKSLFETDTKMDDAGNHDDGLMHSHGNGLSGSPNSDMKPQDDDHGIENGVPLKDFSTEREINTPLSLSNPNLCFDNSGSDTEEEQAAFVKEVEAFYKEKSLEFKHPKFYKEDLNLLKLWRAVIKLGGYEQALLEYERHKIHGGMLPHSDAPFVEPNGVETQAGSNQAPGSGRAKRDAAARAMQSWHSQRVLDNGEVCHPIIKDKTSSPALRSDRQKNFGLLKRKKPSIMEPGARVPQLKAAKRRLDTMVVDIGAPADWVKVNVQKTVDCYEVYALVPGLLREEVHVQSDPVGRLVISGQPKQLDNPWGVTPFKKVVSLPSRIDPHQTSAVVTLHGQLFVRVPYETSPDV
ncbi:AT-rich interactive domain-containing protein 3 [Hibiscus syriacus]|uniref:AT-rich interactive domain-containing protein 3 n=1 Tax=Hibiscus syriacus TaxID=106335 RepID=A0A6A3ADU1_HIBSY|nr:AT-rich interactive domain-containing protein 3 [Hibiscus syriacus]